MTDRPVTVNLLALPEVSASVLYGMLDVFASAGRDWQMLLEGAEPAPRFEPRVVAAGGEPLRVTNGIPVTPDSDLDETPDIVCVPEVVFHPEESLSGRYEAETNWLRRCHTGGSVLATACSGAMLLAEAGLLAGQDATTHWLYCDALAKYPEVRVHRHRALVPTDGGRIVMAGGGSSWHDLALYLVARFASVDHAMQIARLFLIDWHQVGQQPFAMLTCNRQQDDAMIADCQTWIARHYETPAPVQAMIERSGLSERSFSRRFKRATGMTPMDYVHTLRIEESKHLLETSTDPIEGIAHEVGYEDASFFNRLFRRNVGLTPSQYRKRFGGLRRSLQAQTLAASTSQPARGR